MVFLACTVSGASLVLIVQ